MADDDEPRRHPYVIRGYVRDAGGGVVVFVVDRDTESYPPVGVAATLITDPR